ncbi:imidazole glycerol phosphate synthase subunit HisH [Bacillaceae bacterium SIJ1]|uniref:imidazole glycerol phosphate synthase subunit HisH n=1 Tax=Litoribacterium kuwaitense TaxID=1398745 RepID=UPI0013EA4225|nr:imidazole glycerol phosphate synthase subunit HisH [Litoribacterium kuwaitense]NGP45333.1 imidazole glycerol phosphate synthase subunit HisH [Litoribacterium kuwaitense]
MIGIVDYGMGNLFSVSKALERLEYDYVLSANPDELAHAKGLLLPGVGAFKDAATALQQNGFDKWLVEQVQAGVPLLGICLGMQLLYEASEEKGNTRGLGLLKGQAKRFSGAFSDGTGYKVPHMGWNRLSYTNGDAPLLQGVPEGHVYFVHSYYIADTDPNEVWATAAYDVDVPAVVGKNNVMGTQFHPEKSGATGMEILRAFAMQTEGEGKKA